MPVIDIASIEEELGLQRGRVYRVEPFLRASYVNYTHLMLGDHEARHFRCLDEECSSDRIDASPGLVAQAIRGRARWLARVALASLGGCSADDYRSVETKCFQLVLERDRRGREKRVGLVELLFGSLDSAQLASPFKLNAVLHVEGPEPRFPDPMPSRLRLLTMGIKDKKRLSIKAPWEPGTARLDLRVEASTHWPRLRRRLEELNPETSINLEALPCLYTALVAATPLLLGIGKGVTRGFGRFRIESLEALDEARVAKLCPGAWSRFSDSLRCLHTVGEAGAATEALRGLLNALLEIAASATGSEVERSTRLRLIPRLAYAATKAEVVYSRGATSPEAALHVIGEAVLKQRWKESCGDRFGSGVGYHSWPLGLPRKSELPCLCRQGEKPRGRHAYGYVVVTDAVLPSCTERCNTCVPSRHCLNTTLSVESIENAVIALRAPGGEVAQKAKDLRHASPLILFPLPSNPHLIAMLPLPAYSLNLGIDHRRPAPMAHEGSRLVLLHLGGHFTTDKRGNPRPCCNTHVIQVGYAMENSRVGAPVGLGAADGQGGLCGCGPDPAGVRLPPRRGSRCSRQTSTDYEYVVDVAFDWVKYMLVKS